MNAIFLLLADCETVCIAEGSDSHDAKHTREKYLSVLQACTVGHSAVNAFAFIIDHVPLFADFSAYCNNSCTRQHCLIAMTHFVCDGISIQHTCSYYGELS